MNVHHLELFYYVATHGGISAAVRKIPYGIQQPAVSGQMTKLERDLGTKLFVRSPFQLTPAGEKLFAHVRPFFEGLEGVRAELATVEEPVVKIGGAELVLRDHLPVVLRQLKARFPRLRFKLSATGYLSEVESWLRDGHIDIALVPIYGRAPAGLRMTRFAELPLVLQVHRKSGVKTVADLWARRTVPEPLICLPESTGITREFQRELKRRGVTWPHVIEATSLDLVTRYVANGDGIGVNVLTGAGVRDRAVRELPLEGFAPVTMGALWRGEPSPLTQAVIEGVRQYAKTTWPERACAG
jgi:DNA-binding transcriptional LysR family regulator